MILGRVGNLVGIKLLHRQRCLHCDQYWDTRRIHPLLLEMFCLGWFFVLRHFLFCEQNGKCL